MWTRWLLLLALGAAGCSSSGTGRCESDGDCGAGARCDTATGSCLCATDEACPQGTFCNMNGSCQVASGCVTNADCDGDSFCDLESGRCLDGPALTVSGLCGLATHCPPGAVCQDGTCIEGCFDSGDCALGEACIDGLCDPSPGRCVDSSFCEFKSICSEDGFCEEDTRGPFCRLCQGRTLANPNPCSGEFNYCLINNAELGGVTSFCGVDCSEDQPCPNGYTCNDILIRPPGDACVTDGQCQCQQILPRATCQIDRTCEPLLPSGEPDPDAQVCVVEGEPECNGGTPGGPASCIVEVGQTLGQCLCQEDAQCPDGASCVGGDCCTGEIRRDRECIVGEGRLDGFCTCSLDSQCPQDRCDTTRGRCLFNNEPCTDTADCDPIRCDTRDGGGLCFVGRNCAPAQGLACSQVGN